MQVLIDGRSVDVAPGTTVAVAILAAGQSACRRSVGGEARGPMCGMGICYECRVTINGVPHARSCLIVCREGMKVVTG